MPARLSATATEPAVDPSRHRAAARPTAPATQWFGLTEASALLGVSPATLRRWSDAGRIKTFTTPGGHRRYSHAALQRMLPADRDRRPSVIRLGVTPERVTRAYRRLARRPAASETPWLIALDDEQRRGFRDRGRRLAASLVTFLDAETEASRQDQLREASAEAADYGRVTAELGLSLGQAVEGFLRFRSPFIDELAGVARRRGLDAVEATELLQSAERVMDQLLVATMTGHSVTLVGLPHVDVDAGAAAGPDAGAEHAASARAAGGSDAEARADARLDAGPETEAQAAARSAEPR